MTLGQEYDFHILNYTHAAVNNISWAIKIVKTSMQTKIC